MDQPTGSNDVGAGDAFVPSGTTRTARQLGRLGATLGVVALIIILWAVLSAHHASARLKEAAKLGFGRAILPESARGEVGGDAGLSLNTVGGLTSLVADIAARGSPKGNRGGNLEGNREGGTVEKNATPARFRRENG